MPNLFKQQQLHNNKKASIGDDWLN